MQLSNYRLETFLKVLLHCTPSHSIDRVRVCCFSAFPSFSLYRGGEHRIIDPIYFFRLSRRIQLDDTSSDGWKNALVQAALSHHMNTTQQMWEQHNQMTARSISMLNQKPFKGVAGTKSASQLGGVYDFQDHRNR